MWISAYRDIDALADKERWSFERRERTKRFAYQQISRDENLINRREEDREDRRYMIGLYSHQHQRAMGLTIFTPGMGPDGKAAYEYHPADIVIAPMVPPGEAFGGRKINVTVPASFDPVEDGRKLVDAQRRKVTGWSHGAGDGSRVAGDIMLTEVSARGVNFQLLQQNLDTVGTRVAV